MQVMHSSRKFNHVGAYFCKRNIFHKICMLEIKKSRNLNIKTWIVNLGFESSKGEDKSLSAARINLNLVLFRRLRRGDVVCCWPEGKFMILLYDIDQEKNVEKVVKRIKYYFEVGLHICSREDCWYNEEGECELDKIVPEDHTLCKYAGAQDKIELTYDYFSL